MTVYYNEFDPFAAAMLRNLIAAGHIAPGVVDTRSIEDVRPSDLAGFTQCHFFAGVGVWSHALRRAGWTDDRPVWTGSCPCQPFSAAGEGAGFADERHLWPAFHHLIKERKPASVLGEQVASKDADPWIDLVHTDMEALGYAFGTIPFPSAGVGSPQIRDRLYWVADASSERSFPGAQPRVHRGKKSPGARHGEPERPGAAGGLADAIEGQRGWRPNDGALLADGAAPGRDQIASDAERSGAVGLERPGPANGYWRAADWLGCTDGYWRAAEPGTFPLAHGSAARVGRLRAYGNAVNAEAALAWIVAVMESRAA